MLKIFRRKSPSETTQVEITPESLNQLLEECRNRVETLLHISRSMLFFLKEFSLDISEIDTAGFQKRLDQLTENFKEDAPTALIKQTFSDSKLFLIEFISREKEYIQEKEEELKNIIELLRAGLTGLITDTSTFNTRLYEQNIRMESITQLDDIRKIKESLKTEVSQMKQVIQEKQNSDSKRIESLSKEVTVLRSSLEQVRDASMLDALTGSYNRMAFDEQIQKAVMRSEVISSPLSLMMCDLDDFKKINDTYGHIVGDRVLKCFVMECKTMFRNDDFIARYGGEEYAVLLPGLNLKKAVKRAMSFCNILSGKHYLIDANRPDERINFTVSIGVSELRKSDTVEAFIERADQALYKAKRTGKNRAVSEKEI
jgi:diguanylate cyclase